MEEDCVNIPPSEENTEGSANDMASTSDQNMENMEEDCGNNMPSTSEQKVEVSVNIASTSEQNMEEDCGNNIPSTSEQNMEVSVNIASTSEQNMEEDCVDSTASTSEQNMDLGPGSDLECCSNCKAGLNYNEKEGCVSKVRISTLIDAKTANILFPHLLASDFLCTECVTMVVSKTKFSGVNKKRTWAGSGSSSVDSTPPPSKQDKTKGTVVGGGVPSLPPAPTSKQNTEGSRRYVRYATSDLERCSNCKAWLNCNEKEGCVSKVRVSSLIDAETAKILFPHLKPSEFLCTECVKDGTWSGRGSSSVDSTRPPSKRHKAKGTVGGGGVPSLPPAPTSTQNTEGSIRNVVIPKGILSVAPSKQNEGSVNVIKPCRPNMNRVTVIGPSASMLNVASSVNKPSEQNMGASVKAPSTSKPNVKGTVKVPLAFLPNMKGSPQYVVVPRLPTVLPTNWSVKDSANNNDMPSTSEQSAEGSGSKIIRCSLCKKELKYDAKKSLPRIRISTLVDLQTAQVLLPHLSPEDFICKDTCEKWVYSKTMPCAYNKNKRTCTVPTVLPTNRNVKDSGDNDMPCPSEQSTEGSGSDSVRRCSLCKKELIPDKKHKSLARTRISTLVDLKTAQVLLPHLSPEEFICRNPCQKWLHSKTKPMPRNKNKRTWTGFSLKKYPLPYKKMRMDHDSTNTESVSTSDGPSPPPKKKVGKVNQKMMMDRDSTNSKSDGPSPAPKKKVGKVNQVIHYLKGSKYVSAFRRLLEIPAAAAAFNKVFQDIIRKERIKMNRDQEGPFSKQLTPENLASFSWKETNEWVEEKAPLTLTCLRSMFPQAKKITGQHRVCNTKKEPRRFMTEEEAQQLVDKRIAMAMSIVLFTGNSKHTFVQSLIGVEMWREGCPQKMFKIMNSFGVSLSRVTSMNHIVRLQDDHDKEVKLWKGQVEKELRWIYAVHGKRKSGFKGQANQVPAFSLTWDRVKIASHAKHERLGGNKPTIWAFRFAHRNRIPFSYLQGPPKKAVEVSPGSILPSKQTYEALRQRMKTIVMRIIVDNLTALEGLRSKVVWHIPHVYSKQMKEKSNVVNLGAVPVASSTTEGDTEIMDGLIEYVPTLLKKPHKVLCCSDGLNINTTEESSESTAQQRFEGLVDAPPEYPKEFLCYQDIMKMLSSEKSLEARGSLSQLKSVFAVRGLSIDGKVKETILRVWGVDFITFVTSAYITLYAATECNLDAVDGQPSDFPTDAEAQMEWLSGLSHRLVDLVWMPPPQEDINTAAATACLSEVERKEVCFCGEEKTGETLVQCCSNLCGGVWFHEGCAPIDPTTDPTVTQDWFCSPACQGDGTYIYCHCKEQRGGQMVQCALMDQCRRHEWYHKDCLSLSEQGNADSEEPAWYCSEMCVNASDADDHVLNYTKALVWEGLYNMARRDAIKEGDGEAMTDFWKMDMVLFWARKHLKDFTTCHRMLTGIEGFYPEEIRQDLKWNRVANLEGKRGCNISLDLVNEFMNIEFKESLGRVSDHYTNEWMELCGMMAGALGSEANRFLITPGAGYNSHLTTSLASSHVYKTRRQADIAKFVAEYKKDHLFRYIPGRAHQGFEKFTYPQKIKAPKKMGKTMRNLAQDMDKQS